MKIFNWVHKRFHHSVLKDDLAQNVEKTELVTSDKDTQALLKQVALVDALDGWKDGILTIGTFGFDPLKPFNQQPKEYLVLESEEDDEESREYLLDSNDEDGENDNVEDEEVNPLMFTSLGHSFEDVGPNFDADVLEKPDDVLLTLDGVPLAPYVGSDHHHGLGMEQEICAVDQKKKKGERTTLADLFLADADVKMKLDSGKVMPKSNKKLNVGSKNGLSFAKKFIPRVKEDSSPIKNLQRLMKRMLKRKIHPEIDDKINKSDGQKPAAGAAGLVITNGEQAASHEAVSLLPIQGSTSEV
ncbi:protein TILLER ANGLE CONTROL 1 isoform X2 [Ziziphus jujuba]|uniref:Protein TILLER ANGLE CONTROL 1 n=2 Tax=Ziziphus jujuba TaxID=326968 RepID=A0ABM3ISH7_ZIZJJ|nr:protein TILLER ANGLE CONTROL 1 isoform X2 [Ziziphus jujuba]KAH7519442.1 hypothetical protein FEM48_Zijuj08G0036600 [Ziziphus jujuba var. spinosa]